MYPSQTSLIPATVALIRYIEANGFNGNYPFWYLGSTPVKFLIGPLVPILTTLVRIAVPNVSLFSILILFVMLSYILSGVGWGLLVKAITKNNRLGYFVAIIFLLLPAKYFTGFGLEEATYTIARNLLPFLFLLNYKKERLFSLLYLSFLLLINTSILTQVIVGTAAISIDFTLFKKHLKFIVYSLLIATFWYGLNYWKTVLFNPSIGGLTLPKLFLRLFELIRSFLPIILAFFVVRSGTTKRSFFLRYGLIWFGVFVFLTLYRFISDYDFWTDWTIWLPELEIGFAILVGDYVLNKKYKNILYLLPFIVLPSLIVMQNIKLNTLITSTPPEIVNVLAEVNKISARKNVFISGSTVFWANAFFDIYQLRGGRDQFAVNSSWDKASYEFREGIDSTTTKTWLTKLNISYVLVEKESSSDYYHDFKTISKWSSIGEIVWNNASNFIISYK